MKKILFICLSLCIILSKANAQIRDTNSTVNNHNFDADLLMQKSKKQKTAAWILLSGGAIAWFGGVSKNMNQLDNIDGGGKAAMLIGGTAVLSSIPLFIMASKKKKKAMSPSF